ncbi:MAG: DUF4430 domain-containing protein [Dehalococcoidia bacterium]|nr:DUF4430 domain-containing protein [Dehalococcoidia bacterium]
MAALCGVLLCCVAGCAPDAPDGEAVYEGTPPAVSTPAQMRVVATTGFGANVLFDAVVALDEDTTAMAMLASLAEVETSYGDCFVDAVNGVGGAPHGGKVDWFYCMNGIMADSGACDYVLRDGDVEWWDFHDWSFRRNVSATIACFPSIFVNGYEGQTRPSLVAFEQPFASDAERIAQTLRDAGSGDVKVTPVSGLTSGEKEHSNIVLVATAVAEPVQEIYALWDKLGLFTQLEDGELHVFSAAGEEVARFTEGAGVLEAMQNPWNPSGTGACENVVLLVSGCDMDGVRAAADALIIDATESLPLWCGAVIVDGALQSVPGMTG